MIKTALFVCIAALALPFGTYAQENVVCGTDEYHVEIAKQYPQVKQIQAQMEKEHIANRGSQPIEDKGQVLIIPVVFHVIHNNGAEKISLKNIQDQVATLNTCYRLKNADTSLIRTIFRGYAADAKVEFQLATKDPWGNCSNGVTYTVSANTENATDAVKSYSWWDNRHYLNVWVVKSIAQSNIVGTLAGYAQFPWDALVRSSTDGIILNYQFCGKGQKTLVHEIGHYMGLMHTFQDSCSTDQKLQGDHVEDTPPVAAANFGKPVNMNSCHTDNPDLPDMIENYMDYADTKYLFTKGQVYRLRSWLFSPSRNTLWAQENLNNVLYSCSAGIQDEKMDKLSVDIYPNPASNSINLKLDISSSQPLIYEVQDMNGRVLYTSGNINLSTGPQILHLETAQLKMNHAGIYLMKISNGNSVVVKKMILNQ